MGRQLIFWPIQKRALSWQQLSQAKTGKQHGFNNHAKTSLSEALLEGLGLPSAVLDTLVKGIDPTQKGGKRAAKRVRDSLAEYWEEDLGSTEAAQTYVEEMILREAWMMLRNTMDKQTGLIERSHELLTSLVDTPLDDLVPLELTGSASSSSTKDAVVGMAVTEIKRRYELIDLLDYQATEQYDHWVNTHNLRNQNIMTYDGDIELDTEALAFEDPEEYVDMVFETNEGETFTEQITDAVFQFNKACAVFHKACESVDADAVQAILLNPLPGIGSEQTLEWTNNGVAITSLVPFKVARRKT
jgi:hypothetical protein